MDRRGPLGDVDFVAFDTELTGLDFKRDAIISIGAVKLRGTSILPGRTFYRLVRPAVELKRDGVLIHELTHSDLEEAEPMGPVLEEFMDFVGDAVFIGHFVFIDRRFLDRSLRQEFGVKLKTAAVDTATLHDWLHENDSRFARHHGGISLDGDLPSLAKRYDIEMGRAHNAFDDAFATAQLFQRLAHFLPDCGVRSLKDLLSIAGAR